MTNANIGPVKARSFPAAVIAWFKGTSQTPIAGQTSDTLTIQNVSLADNGRYHARFTNSEGYAETTSARLTVNSSSPPCELGNEYYSMFPVSQSDWLSTGCTFSPTQIVTTSGTGHAYKPYYGLSVVGTKLHMDFTFLLTNTGGDFVNVGFLNVDGTLSAGFHISHADGTMKVFNQTFYHSFDSLVLYRVTLDFIFTGTIAQHCVASFYDSGNNLLASQVFNGAFTLPPLMYLGFYTSSDTVNLNEFVLISSTLGAATYSDNCSTSPATAGWTDYSFGVNVLSTNGRYQRNQIFGSSQQTNNGVIGRSLSLLPDTITAVIGLDYFSNLNSDYLNFSGRSKAAVIGYIPVLGSTFVMAGLYITSEKIAGVIHFSYGIAVYNNNAEVFTQELFADTTGNFSGTVVGTVKLVQNGSSVDFYWNNVLKYSQTNAFMDTGLGMFLINNYTGASTGSISQNHVGFVDNIIASKINGGTPCQGIAGTNPFQQSSWTASNGFKWNQNLRTITQAFDNTDFPFATRYINNISNFSVACGYTFKDSGGVSISAFSQLCGLGVKNYTGIPDINAPFQGGFLCSGAWVMRTQGCYSNSVNAWIGNYGYGPIQSIGCNVITTGVEHTVIVTIQVGPDKGSFFHDVTIDMIIDGSIHLHGVDVDRYFSNNHAELQLAGQYLNSSGYAATNSLVFTDLEIEEQ